mmetsp:Transcript_32285/g.74173  ORF Transcript_32285/g.74173 Transcript_32285/m.74173 type:complete len:99 (-) Transcript_32285:212-508(-)
MPNDIYSPRCCESTSKNASHCPKYFNMNTSNKRKIPNPFLYEKIMNRNGNMQNGGGRLGLSKKRSPENDDNDNPTHAHTRTMRRRGKKKDVSMCAAGR